MRTRGCGRPTTLRRHDTLHTIDGMHQIGHDLLTVEMHLGSRARRLGLAGIHPVGSTVARRP